MNPTKAAKDVEVQVFRQTMLLPLALEAPDEADRLNAWIAANLRGTAAPPASKDQALRWHEIEPQGGDDPLLRHVEPSFAFRASTLCDSEGVGENEIFFRDGGKGPKAPREDTVAYSRRWSYAEAAYFHPFVQRFLFGVGGVGEKATRPLRLFRREDIRFLHVEIGYGCELEEAGSKFAAFGVDLAVERCDLYVVEEPGLACLLVEVAATAATKVELFGRARDECAPADAAAECKLGGRFYPVTGIVRPAFTLLEAQALHDGLRRLYPPFFDDFGRDKRHNITLFPGRVALLDEETRPIGDTSFNDWAAHDLASDLIDSGELPVAPWWEAILAPVVLSRRAKDMTAGAPRWRQVVDDRMPTLVFVATKTIEAIARSDLVRLCFADHGGDGFLYDEGFLADFERDHCYDRFRTSGTRYLASSYSFVAVAGKNLDPQKSSFALDVLQEHMRRQYTHMFLITHVQRAALLMFSRWMSEAMHKGASLRDSSYRNALVDIRRRLAEFTHRYWFSNVSNQEQARDLFDLMQRRTETAILYREVIDESAMARGEIEQTATERLQAGAIALAAFLAFASILAVPVGLAQALNSLSGRTMPLSPCAFHLGSAIAGVVAIVAIALVTSVQVEGRIGLTYLARTFAPWRRGRAVRRMRWLVSIALVIMALATGYFWWRAFDFCLAPAAAPIGAPAPGS